MMNSEPHRKVLLKILNEAHVVHNISTEKFEGIIGNITANNYLTFTDDEIPEGKGHNKALHISVKYMNCILARVLIDNGSSLNVIPKETLAKLPSDGSRMKPRSMIVRAFDGSRREVIGEINLPLQIGPITFDVTFQVMDITPTYSFLLGRPWIHSARAMTSTLHQKLKFIADNKLVIISAESDLLVSKPSSTPYIEAAEEALETSFQALEIAHVTCIKEGKWDTEPQSSNALKMVAKVMAENGYQCGQGLGKHEQGISQMPIFMGKQDRFGLGYKPSITDIKRVVEEKKEKKLAKMENREPKTEGVPIYNVKENFRSAGIEFPESIAAIEEYEDARDNWVRVCSLDARLTNWEIIELPEVFSDSK